MPMLEAVEDLGQSEQAHGDDDEIDAVVDLLAAEGESGGADERVESDGRQEQTHTRGGDALDEGAVAERGYQEQSDDRQDRVLGGPELQGRVRDEWCDKGEEHDRGRPTDERPDRRDAERWTGPALAGHRVPIENGDH